MLNLLPGGILQNQLNLSMSNIFRILEGFFGNMISSRSQKNNLKFKNIQKQSNYKRFFKKVDGLYPTFEKAGISPYLILTISFNQYKIAKDFTFFYIGIRQAGKPLRNIFQSQVCSGFLSVQFLVL